MEEDVKVGVDNSNNNNSSIYNILAPGSLLFPSHTSQIRFLILRFLLLTHAPFQVFEVKELGRERGRVRERREKRPNLLVNLCLTPIFIFFLSWHTLTFTPNPPPPTSLFLFLVSVLLPFFCLPSLSSFSASRFPLTRIKGLNLLYSAEERVEEGVADPSLPVLETHTLQLFLQVTQRKERYCKR